MTEKVQPKENEGLVEVKPKRVAAKKTTAPVVVEQSNVVNSTSLITSLPLEMITNRADALKAFKEFIKNDFVDGVDFGQIPNTDKPTLLKAGFEKIQFYLGLSPQYRLLNREFIANQPIKYRRWNEATNSYETAETIRNYYSWEWACDLYNGDTKVAEGVGCANTEERKYMSQYEKAETPDSLANTVMKIAKKRALGDAILNVGGISDMFTVDLEDNAGIKKLKVDKTAGVNKIGKEQIKTIYATLGARNLIDTDLKQILNEFGYLKVQDIKPNEVNKVLNAINEIAKKRKQLKESE